MLKSSPKLVLYIIYHLSACCLTLTSIFLPIGCSQEDIRPRISIPGYESKLLLSLIPETELESWIIEGNGFIKKTADDRLQTTISAGSPGVMVWLKKHISTDFLLEYVIDLTQVRNEIGEFSSPGYCWIFFCAEDQNGDDILKNKNRTGEFNSYNGSEIKSYQISYHCYDPTGEHISGSEVRKNPYHNLLVASDFDPCIENRIYTLHVAKSGGRIQFYADGILIHDVRDGSRYKDIHKSGKLGFWFQGSDNQTILFLDDVRVFKLSPSS